MFSSKKRLDNAYKKAKVLALNKKSKYILFSDCHRSNNSFADDFKHNRDIYFHAMSQYLKEDYCYIELGDGNELWETDFNSIFEANKDIFILLKSFYDRNKLHFIYGNHDMHYRNKKNAVNHMGSYVEKSTGEVKPLFPNVRFYEGIKLQRTNGKNILLIHGHQADFFNHVLWKLSKFLVRFLWKPLQIIGVKDPTSPAQNFKELLKVERHIEHWISKNNNQMVIAGHTHRPHFPSKDELPYFNDGSCVHPRCITGIEINNNTITLIKWAMKTQDDGTIVIRKSVLEGPESLDVFIK